MSIPKAQARPQVTLMFEDLSGLSEDPDLGKSLSSFEYKGMLNGGYVVRGTVIDPHFNMFSKLIKNGYFKESRKKPVKIKFQLRWGTESEATFPESATKIQIANLISLKAVGKSDDSALLEFVAIDPPSWFLNRGDASGKVYKGKVSDVIKQVVKEYAPDVKLDITETIDSKEGKWWMMRQDPKSFISSLFDWSSSITKTKTQWVFIPGQSSTDKEGKSKSNLAIKEQGELQSKQRGFYRYLIDGDESHDTIRNWEFLADNALSLVETKMVTQGLSAISGQYLDDASDEKENKVVIKDKRTPNKSVANIKDDAGFSKPDDSDKKEPYGASGWTSISAIPENSAGDLGIRYEEYIDGRPRGMWLNLTNALMRVKLECVGHGEWSNCEGLGVDTVFIKWTSGKPDNSSNSSGEGIDEPFFWMTGHWLVYGFHHRLTRGFWYTDLYLARFDHDAKAEKVPSRRTNPQL